MVGRLRQHKTLSFVQENV